MSELSNPYPQWGQDGSSPGNGFSYDQGDQVNESNFDYLWDKQYESQRTVNDSLRRRVTDLHESPLAIDGLRASNSSMDVSVTASSGAYVNGEYTGPTTSKQWTLSSNSTSSVREDSIYVDMSGNVVLQEGTTNLPSDAALVAILEVSTTDTVTVHNHLNRQVGHTKSGEMPDLPEGSLWYDEETNALKLIRGPNTASDIATTDGFYSNLDLHGYDIQRVDKITDPYNTTSSRLQLGQGKGPHRLTFGRDQADNTTGGLNFVYRTGPEELHIEEDKADGETVYWSIGRNGVIDQSGSEYVVLPTRSSLPSNAPNGATFILE